MKITKEEIEELERKFREALTEARDKEISDKSTFFHDSENGQFYFAIAKRYNDNNVGVISSINGPDYLPRKRLLKFIETKNTHDLY